MLDVAYRHLCIRFHIPRHRLVALSLNIRQISLSGRLAEHVVETPYPGFAGTQAGEIQRTIGIRKTEILIQPVEITFFTCKGNDIRRIQAVFFVVHVELMDTALVCMSCNAVIRNTDSYPHCSFHTGTLTDHFHDPGFIRIGDGERFAAAVITILLHEICHHLDGFLRSTRTLQSYIDQASVVHDTGSIHQFRTTSESRFTDGHLIFVHVSDHIIRLLGLFDLAQILAAVPVKNVTHGSCRMRSCREMAKEAEHTVRVCRIRYDHRPVGRSLLADDKVGTGPTVHKDGCQHHDSQD